MSGRLPTSEATTSDNTTSENESRGRSRGDANPFKPRNAEVAFHGRKWTNTTHRSLTDPEAKPYRKGFGKEALPCHMGHAVAENRHGLVMSAAVTEASGTAERDAALAMLDRLSERYGSA